LKASLSRCVAIVIALLLSAPALPTLADADQAQRDDEKSDSNPDIDMLEFLGEWEVKDGSWVDPMALQDEINMLPQRNSAVNEDMKDESR